MLCTFNIRMGETDISSLVQYSYMRDFTSTCEKRYIPTLGV